VNWADCSPVTLLSHHFIPTLIHSFSGWKSLLPINQLVDQGVIGFDHLTDSAALSDTRGTSAGLRQLRRRQHHHLALEGQI
jgi:hypothetical protein